ncbi:MAG: hypothetical protein MZV64_11165 [Ignavibacteriales bacterium]|nr:hypothetical protein [Ignavibacteriales bacterium]
MGPRRQGLRQLGRQLRRQGLGPDVRPLDGQAQRPLPAALGLQRFGHPRRPGRAGRSRTTSASAYAEQRDPGPGLYRVKRRLPPGPRPRTACPSSSNLSFRRRKERHASAPGGSSSWPTSSTC